MSPCLACSAAGSLPLALWPTYASGPSWVGHYSVKRWGTHCTHYIEQLRGNCNVAHLPLSPPPSPPFPPPSPVSLLRQYVDPARGMLGNFKVIHLPPPPSRTPAPRRPFLSPHPGFLLRWIHDLVQGSALNRQLYNDASDAPPLPPLPLPIGRPSQGG